jgi:hypothetical protein
VRYRPKHARVVHEGEPTRRVCRRDIEAAIERLLEPQADVVELARALIDWWDRVTA